MKTLKEKPFALIGVNINHREAPLLKEIMVKENLNWRSFADRGGITARWNISGTPTYYIIDHQGLIRHKWFGSPGEKAIDNALAILIRTAVREVGKPPK